MSASGPKKIFLPDAKEQSTREYIANLLQHEREKLSHEIQQKMSDATNEHLWQDAPSLMVAQVKEQDLQYVKDLKYSLLTLQYLENALRSNNPLRIINEVIGSSISGAFSLQGLYNQLHSAYTTIKESPQTASTRDFLNAAIKQQIAKIVGPVRHILNYRIAAPTHPTQTFTLPPPPSNGGEWWSHNPNTTSLTLKQSRDFEYAHLLNPIRTLMTTLEHQFPREAPFSTAQIDEHGFFILPTLEKSKPLFRQQHTLFLSVRALYNVMWSINRLARVFNKTEDLFEILMKIVKGPAQTKIALEHLTNEFWLIDLSTNIQKELIKNTKTAIKTFLKTTAKSFLSNISRHIPLLQQYELDYHLKPGILNNELRKYFSLIEDFYLMNNLYIENPFTSDNISSLQEVHETIAQEQKEHEYLIDLNNCCRKLSDGLQRFVSHQFPHEAAQKDVFILSILNDINRLLILNPAKIKDAPQKNNLEKIQEILINELSYAASKHFFLTLNESKELDVSTIYALKNKIHAAHPKQIAAAVAMHDEIMGANWFTSTMQVFQLFINTFFSPLQAPSAIASPFIGVGNNNYLSNSLPAVFTYDLRLMFSLPPNYQPANIFILTQEPEELVYFNHNHQKRVVLNQEEMSKLVEVHPFLKPFLIAGTQPISNVAHVRETKEPNPSTTLSHIKRNASIKAQLTEEQLTILNDIIQSKGGPAYALLPNKGILPFLYETQSRCQYRIQEINHKIGELNSILAQKPLDLAAHRFQSSLRLLKPGDLLRMIKATELTENFSQLNLDIKSRLAALLSSVTPDFIKEFPKKEEVIERAHIIATRLVKHPQQLSYLIQTLFEDKLSTPKDKLFCRELMKQLTLIPSFVTTALAKKEVLNFVSEDKEDQQQAVKNNLIKILAQFDAMDLVRMIVDPTKYPDAPGSEEKKLSLAAFRLVIAQLPLTDQNMQTSLKKIDSFTEFATDGKDSAPSLSKGQLIGSDILKTLFRLYQEYAGDNIMKTKIGLFLANLALKNRTFAELVFHTPAYHDIVKEACLNSNEKSISLYYEAWINSLPEAHMKYPFPETSFIEVAKSHQHIIEGMHAAFHNTPFNVDNYLQRPWELCKLQGDFINQCLSRESKAEKIIKLFFTRLVFLEEKRIIQQNLAFSFYKHFGETNAPYYKFIANHEEINIFWDIEKDSSLKRIEDYRVYLTSQHNKFMALAQQRQNLLSPLQKNFTPLFSRASNISSNLKDKTSKIPNCCLHAYNELNKLKKDGSQLIKKWYAFFLKSSSQKFSSSLPPSLSMDVSPGSVSHSLANSRSSSMNISPEGSAAPPPPLSPMSSLSSGSSHFPSGWGDAKDDADADSNPDLDDSDDVVSDEPHVDMDYKVDRSPAPRSFRTLSLFGSQQPPATLQEDLILRSNHPNEDSNNRRPT